MNVILRQDPISSSFIHINEYQISNSIRIADSTVNDRFIFFSDQAV